MSVESDGGMILTGGNRRNRRETCPSATLSTKNPTWIDPGANLGIRGEKPAANRLSHGTATCMELYSTFPTWIQDVMSWCKFDFSISFAEPGSSVSIVSGYGLDDRVTRGSILGTGERIVPVVSVSRPTLDHPASCPVGTGGLYPGLKRGRAVTMTTHPHPVPRSWMSRSYTSSPPCASVGVLWDCFTNLPLPRNL
jgi:hypothetical protein